MSLRERLLARTLPSADHPVRTAESAEVRRCEEELAAAQRKLRLLEVQKNAPADRLRKARKAVEAAQAALDDCFEQVTFTALPPESFEGLQDEHPEPDSDEKSETRARDTAFSWHLFLACAPDELSEDEWRHVVYQTMSQGERLELFSVVFELNLSGRRPSRAVPKG